MNDEKTAVISMISEGAITFAEGIALLEILAPFENPRVKSAPFAHEKGHYASGGQAHELDTAQRRLSQPRHEYHARLAR